MLIAGIQFAKADPVFQRTLRVIGNAHLTLQRRTNQRHTTKRPQCQPAQTLGRIAVDQSHTLACPQQLDRRDNAGDTAANDQGIRLNMRRHTESSGCLLLLSHRIGQCAGLWLDRKGRWV